MRFLFFKCAPSSMAGPGAWLSDWVCKPHHPSKADTKPVEAGQQVSTNYQSSESVAFPKQSHITTHQ